eukprot:GHVT01087623.1.p1 GENE.GHVT01087623.1~~GHVT01087623.1.p1  ORF type:complete len:946 (+),score=272.41 GHVT01087623.1:424-3261(+)
MKQIKKAAKGLGVSSSSSSRHGTDGGAGGGDDASPDGHRRGGSKKKSRDSHSSSKLQAPPGLSPSDVNQGEVSVEDRMIRLQAQVSNLQQERQTLEDVIEAQSVTLRHLDVGPEAAVGALPVESADADRLAACLFQLSRAHEDVARLRNELGAVEAQRREAQESSEGLGERVETLTDSTAALDKTLKEKEDLLSKLTAEHQSAIEAVRRDAKELRDREREEHEENVRNFEAAARDELVKVKLEAKLQLEDAQNDLRQATQLAAGAEQERERMAQQKMEQLIEKAREDEALIQTLTAENNLRGNEVKDGEKERKRKEQEAQEIEEECRKQLEEAKVELGQEQLRSQQCKAEIEKLQNIIVEKEGEAASATEKLRQQQQELLDERKHCAAMESRLAAATADDAAALAVLRNEVENENAVALEASKESERCQKLILQLEEDHAKSIASASIREASLQEELQKLRLLLDESSNQKAIVPPVSSEAAAEVIAASALSEVATLRAELLKIQEEVKAATEATSQARTEATCASDELRMEREETGKTLASLHAANKEVGAQLSAAIVREECAVKSFEEVTHSFSEYQKIAESKIASATLSEAKASEKGLVLEEKLLKVTEEVAALSASVAVYEASLSSSQAECTASTSQLQAATVAVAACEAREAIAVQQRDAATKEMETLQRAVRSANDIADAATAAAAAANERAVAAEKLWEEAQQKLETVSSENANRNPPVGSTVGETSDRDTQAGDSSGGAATAVAAAAAAEAKAFALAKEVEEAKQLASAATAKAATAEKEKHLALLQAGAVEEEARRVGAEAAKQREKAARELADVVETKLEKEKELLLTIGDLETVIHKLTTRASEADAKVVGSLLGLDIHATRGKTGVDRTSSKAFLMLFITLFKHMADPRTFTLSFMPFLFRVSLLSFLFLCGFPFVLFLFISFFGLSATPLPQ